jgi:hypothetical protein
MSLRSNYIAQAHHFLGQYVNSINLIVINNGGLILVREGVIDLAAQFTLRLMNTRCLIVEIFVQKISSCQILKPFLVFIIIVL